jgi:hypothetical protein
MSNGDFSKRTGGSSHRPSGFGWGLQGYREHQEQALDPQPCEPSRRQQHFRRRILTNLTQTTTPKSSGHLSTLSLLIILTLSMDITVLILVRVKVLTYPPMNYLVVMDHHTVMDFLVDLSADI